MKQKKLFSNWNYKEDYLDRFANKEFAHKQLERDYRVAMECIKIFVSEYKDFNVKGLVGKEEDDVFYKFKLSDFKGFDRFIKAALKDCDVLTWGYFEETDELMLSCAGEYPRMFLLTPIV